jgi:hypothetical protein
MLGWIVRIFFILAAPIATLFVAHDALNFGLVQTFIAMILMVAFVTVVALWSGRPGKTTPPR